MRTAILFALAATITSTTPVVAYAAGGSLFVNQTSSTSEIGNWSVILPSGSTYQSAVKTKVLSDIETGTYTLTVTNPANSLTSITMLRNGSLYRKVTGTTVTFDVADGDEFRANIEYTFAGTVEVVSKPANVAFTMKNMMDGTVFTGVTPTVFTGMSPVQYRVRYDIQPSCEVQKEIERNLVQSNKLIFSADFTCGDKTIPIAGKTNTAMGTVQKIVPSKEEAVHTEIPDKRIMQTSSLSEVVPGGNIHFTITVKNTTRSTVHDIDITDHFNPEMMDIVHPISDGGTIVGNEIQWNVPQIFAGQTWTTTFTARAKDTLKPGDRIVLMAHATSIESDFDLYPEAWSAVVGVGVAYLPQTGGKYDVLFAIAALFGAAIVTQGTRKRMLQV